LQRRFVFSFNPIENPCRKRLVKKPGGEAFLSAKANFCGNVIRTGMTLNSTSGNVDELFAALDKGFALC
jgi:hypothetical protein